jgi:hypothetical protein
MGLYGEMYPASQAMNMKTEEVSDAQEDADPLQITVQEMKAEPEVSLCSVCPLLGKITDMLKWQLSGWLVVCLYT